MKSIFTALGATLLALSFWAVGPAFAQTTMDNGQMGAAAAPGWTDGEVRKMDKATGKLTLKHGEIKHMDMPGMTMVFTAKDKSLLTGIKPGDKIKFMAVSEGGKLIVTDIQPIR